MSVYDRSLGAIDTYGSVETSPSRSSSGLSTTICIGIDESGEGIVEGTPYNTTGRNRALRGSVDEDVDR